MKTTSYDFKAFMKREHVNTTKPPTLSLAPLAVAPFIPTPAFAETADIQSKMMTAFQPLIDLVQSLAYPVAMFVVVGGSLFVMIGNKEKGFTLMQNAALGYMLVVIAPLILDVLVDATKAVM